MTAELTLDDILTYKTETPLQREVKQIILNNIEEDYIVEFFEDLMNNGCVSGMISELIYYKDTLSFYNRHKDEINEMLSEILGACGFDCPSQLFGDKWDNNDPLALETQNQNLLAWFVFEETSRTIAENLGIEL